MKKDSRFSVYQIAQFILLIVVLAGLVLVGCAPSANPNDLAEVTIGNTEGGVVRYIDREAGIVCRIYNGNYSGGIDCMPIEDTLLAP